MSNYAETKKELDRIRDEYGCKGEILFRTSIQYVVDCGQQNFQDAEWVNEQLDITDKKHDAFDRENKTPFISREFEKALVECAQEIAKVNTYDLLVYIQREVWLGGSDGMDYQRVVELLKNCVGWFVDDCCSREEIIDRLELLDLNDNDIEFLGYGYLLNTFYTKEEE